MNSIHRRLAMLEKTLPHAVTRPCSDADSAAALAELTEIHRRIFDGPPDHTPKAATKQPTMAEFSAALHEYRRVMDGGA